MYYYICGYRDSKLIWIFISEELWFIGNILKILKMILINEKLWYDCKEPQNP